MWKSLAALALSATLLGACGDEPSGTTTASADATAPTAVPTPTTPTARPAPASGPADPAHWPPPRGPIPRDLPLDQDLEWYPGDGGERLGPSPAAPGVDGAVACGTPLWPPADVTGVTGRLAVTGTGPEHGDVREVVTFAEEAQARAALDHVRAVVEACPTQELPDGGVVTWHELDADPGLPGSTYASSLSPGIGGTAVQASVMGNAVLLVQVHGEFGPDSHPHVARELTARTRTVAPMLCFATAARCGTIEPPTIGPDGVGEVALGMSATEVEALGAWLEDGHGVDCTTFSLRLPSGERVAGAVAPDIGVSRIFVDHGRTPEGAGPGTTYDDLRAIYAGELSGPGPKGLVVPVPHSDRQYELVMSADRVEAVVLAFAADPC